MTTDVTARLRAADPCPAGAAYDDATVERHVRAIVDADRVDSASVVDHTPPVDTVPAPERLELGPAPRPRRGRRWAVAAVAAVVLAGGAVTGVVVAADRGTTTPAAESWVRYRDGYSPVSFDHPASWVEYHRDFQPTMSALLVWLSTVPFANPCTSSSSADGTVSEGCTYPTPDLRRGGVFVAWSSGDGPGTADLVPDPNGQVGGYLARVDRDEDAASTCPGQGAVAAVSALVAYPSSSQTTRMTACVGPGDVTGDLAAVDRMLASVTFAPDPSPT